MFIVTPTDTRDQSAQTVRTHREAREARRSIRAAARDRRLYVKIYEDDGYGRLLRRPDLEH